MVVRTKPWDLECREEVRELAYEFAVMTYEEDWTADDLWDTLRYLHRLYSTKDRVAKGSALAEAYVVAERLQDVLGQCRAEAGPAGRRAIERAEEHYHRMRDAIVDAASGELVV